MLIGVLFFKRNINSSMSFSIVTELSIKNCTSEKYFKIKIEIMFFYLFNSSVGYAKRKCTTDIFLEDAI